MKREDVPVVGEGTRFTLKDGRTEVSLVCVVSNMSGHPTVIAHTAEGIAIGSLRWERDCGDVGDIRVDPRYQRNGVGRLLWRTAGGLAELHSEVQPPCHSATRTRAGDAFARAVGGELPPLRDGQFEDLDNGHTVTST